MYSGDRLLLENHNVALDYDYITMAFFQYYEGYNSGALELIRSHSSKTKIFVYKIVTEIDTSYDEQLAYTADNIARYQNARGHSMGAIDDHQDWYITDATTGEKVINDNYTVPENNKYLYLLDFRKQEIIDYGIEAIVTDISDAGWVEKPDGIFIDLCMPVNDIYSGTFNQGLNTETEWLEASNTFVDRMTKEIHDAGYISSFNRGYTRNPTGVTAWSGFNLKENQPSLIMEEGTFVTQWGTSDDAQFYSEIEWMSQYATINNSIAGVTMNSHCDADSFDDAGLTPNRGNTVSVREVHRYAYASFLLTYRQEKDCFSFYLKNYNHPAIQDGKEELSYIDMGDPIGVMFDYQGVKCREFQKGYVYVNISDSDKSIELHRPMGLYTTGTRRVKNSELTKAASGEVEQCRAVFAFK